MILKLWKTTLEAKKKQLVEHQGVVSGTPETSDDEDEDDDEHDSTFCTLQQQRISWRVSPNERTKENFYQNDPAPPQMVPHKLITSVKPHEKSRSLEGRGIGTQQEQINVDAGIVNIGCCNSPNGLEIKQSFYGKQQLVYTIFLYSETRGLLLGLLL